MPVFHFYWQRSVLMIYLNHKRNKEVLSLKKTLSFLLMILLTCGICSCSSNSEIDYEMGSNALSMDFGGYEFIIMQENFVESGKERTIYLNTDMIKRRLAEISEDWNCTVKIERAYLRIYLNELKEILYIGVPTGLQSCFYSIANICNYFP